MQGVISRLQVLDGKFGKYTDIEIGGDKITAYNTHHQAAQNMAEGDSVEYTFELKNGKYKNFTFLKKVGSGAGAAVTAVAKRSEMSKDESMVVSYAKDLMVGGLAAQPEDAVKMVFSLLKATREGFKENPTS